MSDRPFFVTKIVVWWDRMSHIVNISDFLQGIPQKPPSEMALKRPWSNFAPRFYAFYLWSSWSF